MKRTPLTRKTELKRKSPIRRMSAKKRNEIDETGPMRKAYVENQGLCEDCGKATACDNHEMASGNCRSAACYIPNAWLALCRSCHTKLQGGPVLPQAAIKCRSVLRDLNSLRDGRQQFTLAELIAELVKLT